LLFSGFSPVQKPGFFATVLIDSKDVKFVLDFHKTRNAKVMRRVVRTVYLGEPPGDLSALVNPEAVEEIRGAS